MFRRLLALLLMPIVLLAGIGPAGAAVSSGSAAHACCRTMQATAPHDGCPQAAAAARMRCCAPAPDRDSETQVPRASSTASPRPDFTLLAGHAAYVPGLPALAGASAAHAFESARLRLPSASLYLRNLVLLV